VSASTNTVELRRLLEAAREGDEKARTALVEEHQPLVRALASRYAGRGEPFEDLVQVASIGLVLAIDRFDPERGVPFKSFAVPTMVGEIRRHFRDRAWALHVPRRLKELSVQLNRTVEYLTAELRRAPTIAELADAIGVPEDEIVDALDVSNAYSTSSFTEPRFDGDGDEHDHRDTYGAPDSGFEEVEDAATVDAGMAALDERMQRIVELRFFEGRTQSEIAADVGISQMHVSRLLRQSLDVMRDRLDELGARP
jgi:RNA polymerase sigma-B factor